MGFEKLKQSFFNLFSKFFVRFRYRNKKDPFKILGEILKNSKADTLDKNKGIVLITPVRVSPMSNLFEALIGKFYQLKGYEVKFLMCNQVITYCENIDKKNNRFIACALCKEEQKRFALELNVDILKANEFISDQEIFEIRKKISDCKFSDKTDFIFDGVDLYEPILAGVMRYTLKSDVIGDEYLIKKFAESAFIYSKIMSNIFKSFKIEKLITSHGIYSTWGSILETAKNNKIDTIVWGRGYTGQGNLLFSRNQNLEREFSTEGREVIDNITLSKNQIDIIKDYFLKKMNPNSNVDYINYYKDLKFDNSDFSFFDLLKNYKKTFGMFTNIPWDGEMLKTTDSFPTTRTFVKAVVEWFLDNQDCLLIIRAHPAEASREEGVGAETFEELLFGMYPNLPDNILFIKPASNMTSYNVSQIVDAIILFGSTMSLELAIQKKIVIQSGMNNVSNKGIVFDCFTKDELYNHLNMVKNNEISFSNEMYNNALKYAFYWIYKRHIVESTIELDKLVFEKYNFKNNKEFLEDEMLNFVFNKINNNEKIIYG